MTRVAILRLHPLPMVSSSLMSSNYATTLVLTLITAIFEMKDRICSSIAAHITTELWSDLGDSYFSLLSELVRKEPLLRGNQELMACLQTCIHLLSLLAERCSIEDLYFVDSLLRFIHNGLYTNPTYASSIDLTVLIRGLKPILSNLDGDQLTVKLAEIIIVGLLIQDQKNSSLLSSSGLPESVSNQLKQYYVACASVYTQVQTIQARHFDDEEVSESLEKISSLLTDSDIAKFFYTFTDACFLVHIQCMSNIDQSVIRASCLVTFSLVSEDAQIQEEFIHRGGIGLLHDSLHDYEIDIKLMALQILGSLVNQNEDVRSKLRTEGILDTLLKTVAQYPAEDITPEILSHTMTILANSLIDDDTNQEYIMNQKGPQFMARFLDERLVIVSSMGLPQYINVLEKSLVVLANLTYKNSALQDSLRIAKLVETMYSFLNEEIVKTQVVQKANVDLLVACLNLMINFADTNQTNQAYLTGIVSVSFLKKLMESAFISVSSLACLLLSHLCWNHPTNQVHYGCEEIIRCILDIAQKTPVESNAHAAKVNTSWRSDQTSRENYDLCMFSLMALVNMSFQQHHVQDMVARLGGVKVVTTQLWSANYDCRTTAAFCLGNLVKAHSENSKQLRECGGIMRLCEVVNDAEEDQLSHRAFVVLSNTNDIAIDAIAVEYGKIVTSSKPISAQESELIEKLLSIMNGLIYVSDSACAFAQSTRLPSALLRILDRKDVPITTREFALYVSENISAASPKGAKYVDLSIVPLLPTKLGDFAGSQAGRKSIYRLLLLTCTNLPQSSVEVGKHMKPFFPVLLSDCKPSPPSSEDEKEWRVCTFGLLGHLFAALSPQLSTTENTKAKELIAWVSKPDSHIPITLPK
eukprot:TRINITY_DN2988_c0_g1_i2.p1 TRINITY_DN2988_c0_g1~~TRINITY_DN2988_c0_g1_i2.p1  ORF type:complete len:867 (-),score=153.67 TRINITY_DN2988_c0_g1_i2:76-2676(-)